MDKRGTEVTIHVDFPAVADLVSYLKTRDDQQKQIDVLAAQVRELTHGLHLSNTELKNSIERPRS